MRLKYKVGHQAVILLEMVGSSLSLELVVATRGSWRCDASMINSRVRTGSRRTHFEAQIGTFENLTADESSLSFKVRLLSLGVSSVNCPPNSSEISKIWATSQLHQPHTSKSQSFLLLVSYGYSNAEGFGPPSLCRTPANSLE